MEKLILRFIWKHQRLQVAKTVPRKKKKKQARDNGILEFKLYYRAIVTETDMLPDGIEERNHKLIP